MRGRRGGRRRRIGFELVRPEADLILYGLGQALERRVQRVGGGQGGRGIEFVCGPPQW
ncbi:hypothetical protein [Belnapia rosea]|uniref:hypothetical protein n=1 Tax=Belnapia rosea TaxID=938405 RepID=UPI001C40B060|nr:hypothetical protein [Belnapia rosea]